METLWNKDLQKLIFIALFSILFPLTVAAQGESSAPDNLQSFGTIGKELTPLEGSKEAQLFYHEGKGCLTHMWFGGDFPDYGRTRIRIYADGETKASIDMELMLGHGIGFQDPAAPWGIERMGKTGQYSDTCSVFCNGLRPPSKKKTKRQYP